MLGGTAPIEPETPGGAPSVVHRGWHDRRVTWPPQSDQPLPNADRAYGVHEKLAGYSLRLDHPGRGEKAEGFARVLAITADDLVYLTEALLSGVRTTPVSRVRPAGEYGSHCEVIVPVRGLRDRADRIANVLTAWQIRREGDPPRLITAYIVSRVR